VLKYQELYVLICSIAASVLSVVIIKSNCWCLLDIL